MAVAVEISGDVIHVAGCTIQVADVLELMSIGMSKTDAIAALYKVSNAEEEGEVRVIPIEEPQYNFENDQWSQEEDDVLIDNVLDEGYSGVAEMLPKRTYPAVVSRGRKLGLSIGKDRKYQKWSEAEKDFLLQYRDRFTYKELGALLGRTGRAVKNQWGRINQ